MVERAGYYSKQKKQVRLVNVLIYLRNHIKIRTHSVQNMKSDEREDWENSIQSINIIFYSRDVILKKIRHR